MKQKIERWLELYFMFAVATLAGIISVWEGNYIAAAWAGIAVILQVGINVQAAHIKLLQDALQQDDE